MNIKICDRWDAYLDKFQPGQKDIYYMEGYTRLYEDDEGRALCIVCEEGQNVLLMPFIRKSVRGFFDFETAYGYGGPIANTEDQIWIDQALAEMQECFKREKYICGFIRFHPLLDNGEYCKNVLDVMPDRHTVMIDLRPGEDEIWKSQISSKNRNMIRKAEKLGLQYDAEYDFASMEDFIALYRTTMKRLGAEKFYYFKDEYYGSFVREMAGRGFLGTVRYKEKMIGAAIFMYSEHYGHYHLAGSDREYADFGINNFLLWNTAKELKKQGIKEFHLGGGTGALEEDSLFKFKRSFSRTVKVFYIGKCIFNREVYDEVCEEWEKGHEELIPVLGNRLLKYRCGREDGYEEIDG